MNIDMMRKIAEGESKGSGGDNSGTGGIQWMPIAGAGLSALLAHSLLSPSEEEKKKKKESTMSKLLRWLTVAGAGAGGYYLAKGLGGKSDGSAAAPDPMTIDKARLALSDANFGKYTFQGGRWALHGTGAAADATGIAKLWKNIRGQATAPTSLGKNFLKNLLKGLREGGPFVALGAGIHGLGALADEISDRYGLSASEKERYLSELLRQSKQ